MSHSEKGKKRLAISESLKTTYSSNELFLPESNEIIIEVTSSITNYVNSSVHSECLNLSNYVANDSQVSLSQNNK